MERPLVSVRIHNYNYGRYLRQCLDSVFEQTYPNIEIAFADNASDDDSWEIANRYARMYPGKMTIIRQSKNRGPTQNSISCGQHAFGTYFVALCSDDALEPEYVERCVELLEAHPRAGFAMTHRAIIDAEGNRTEEPPFYNKTCLIPGPEQAAVYMMSSVNPCMSQTIYRARHVTEANRDYNPRDLGARWFGPRITDFNLCCEHDLIYIKDPLVLHRIHKDSDSHQMLVSLVELFGQYLLPHQFAEIASGLDGMERVVERLPAAVEKLGHLCLRYAAGALLGGDEVGAYRCFHLALAVNPLMAQDESLADLFSYFFLGDEIRPMVLESLAARYADMGRTVSYDPPEGSVGL